MASKEKVKNLLLELHGEELKDKFQALLNKTLSDIDQLNPSDIARIKESAVTKEQEIMNALFETIIPIYMDNFSDQEIEQLLAWQRTPVGLKMMQFNIINTSRSAIDIYMPIILCKCLFGEDEPSSRLS